MTLAESLSIEHTRTRMHYHALTRASERHGLRLTDADLEAIVTAIGRKGPDVLTLRVDHGMARRKVALWREDRWLILIYDELYRAVVTFYPPSSAIQFQGVLGRARSRRGFDAVPLTYDERAAAIPPSELVPPGDGRPPVGTVLGRVELPLGTKPWCNRDEARKEPTACEA